MVLACVSEIANAIRKRDKKVSRWLRFVIAIFITYCMYRHCVNCQPWNGFWKTMLFGAIAQAILSAFLDKDSAPDPPSY